MTITTLNCIVLKDRGHSHSFQLCISLIALVQAFWCDFDELSACLKTVAELVVEQLLP